MNVDPKALLGRWRHSHDEDQSRVLVFRHDDFEFPPSRGRMSFELLSGGKTRYEPIGAADEVDSKSGKWRVDESGHLIIDSAGRIVFKARVADVTESRLELDE